MEIQVNKPGIYSELDLTKKQFENCLLPLWIYGEATSHEISELLKIPITEIVEHFKASAMIKLICFIGTCDHINSHRPLLWRG